MIQQMISATRWWKQTFFLVFYACFKIRTWTYVSHLPKPLLPSQNLVGWCISLYCEGLMVCQTISAPKWGEKIFLLIFSVCFKTRTRAYVSHPSKLLLPWRNLVRWYIISYYAMWGTNDLSDDFRSKMAETDVLARLVGLLQAQGSGVRQSSIEIIEVITALANFGWLINHFILCDDWWSHRGIPLQDDWNRCCCLSRSLSSEIALTRTRVICQGHHHFGEIWYVVIFFWTVEGLTVKQIVSALRWWRPVSFSTLLTRQCESHISRSLLPWSNPVRQPTLRMRHYLSFLRSFRDWDVGCAKISTVSQDDWRWGCR